jgi:hypothetical protein
MAARTPAQATPSGPIVPSVPTPEFSIPALDVAAARAGADADAGVQAPMSSDTGNQHARAPVEDPEEGMDSETEEQQAAKRSKKAASSHLLSQVKTPAGKESPSEGLEKGKSGSISRPGSPRKLRERGEGKGSSKIDIVNRGGRGSRARGRP